MRELFATETTSAAKTKKLGRAFGRELFLLKPRARALLVSLEGELGGGKTTFVQGMVKGLGIREKVLSPSFLIMKLFRIPRGSPFRLFYHVDAYRIKSPRELTALDFRKLLRSPHNIIVIEWAGRVSRLLPRQRVNIRFAHISARVRRLAFFSHEEASHC